MSSSSNDSSVISDPDIWHNASLLVPAIMTLICFVCTAVSLTVSGFICLRDREAQDASDNKAKHLKEQEFVSSVLGLFYKIRTSNVFRVQEIVQDLNDDRPVWIGTKSEIITNLEFYGIVLTEREKTNLMASSEVFEIDCEALFYFELERFAKASAAFGTNVLQYYECIYQDGASYPREFYPDTKPIFQSELIYNVFTEMQQMTELLVKLSTGIDLEILNIYALPMQIRHSGIAAELRSVQDFLYNFYLRVYPRERSTASITRMLPKLPVIYEPVDEVISFEAPKESPVKQILVEEPEPEEIIEDDIRSVGTLDTMDLIDEDEVPPLPTGRIKSRRLSELAAKQRVRAVKVYKRLSDRIKQRGFTDIETASEPSTLSDPRQSTSQESLDAPPLTSRRDSEFSESKQVRFRDPTPGSTGSPPQYQLQTVQKLDPDSRRGKKPALRSASSVQVLTSVTQPVQTVESVRESMRFRYKAPPRRDGYSRRRGRLASRQQLQHNAFTYMVTRVLGFLEGRVLKEAELQNQMFLGVDRSFIV